MVLPIVTKKNINCEIFLIVSNYLLYVYILTNSLFYLFLASVKTNNNETRENTSLIISNILEQKIQVLKKQNITSNKQLIIENDEKVQTSDIVYKSDKPEKSKDTARLSTKVKNNRKLKDLTKVDIQKFLGSIHENKDKISKEVVTKESVKKEVSCEHGKQVNRHEDDLYNDIIMNRDYSNNMQKKEKENIVNQSTDQDDMWNNAVFSYINVAHDLSKKCKGSKQKQDVCSEKSKTSESAIEKHEKDYLNNTKTDDGTVKGSARTEGLITRTCRNRLDKKQKNNRELSGKMQVIVKQDLHSIPENEMLDIDSTLNNKCTFVFHSIAKRLEDIKTARPLPRIEGKIIHSVVTKMTPLFETTMMKGELSSTDDESVQSSSNLFKNINSKSGISNKITNAGKNRENPFSHEAAKQSKKDKKLKKKKLKKGKRKKYKNEKGTISADDDVGNDNDGQSTLTSRLKSLSPVPFDDHIDKCSLQLVSSVQLDGSMEIDRLESVSPEPLDESAECRIASVSAASLDGSDKSSDTSEEVHCQKSYGGGRVQYNRIEKEEQMKYNIETNQTDIHGIRKKTDSIINRHHKIATGKEKDIPGNQHQKEKKKKHGDKSRQHKFITENNNNNNRIEELLEEQKDTHIQKTSQVIKVCQKRPKESKHHQKNSNLQEATDGLGYYSKDTDVQLSGCSMKFRLPDDNKKQKNHREENYKLEKKDGEDDSIYERSVSKEDVLARSKKDNQDKVHNKKEEKIYETIDDNQLCWTSNISISDVTHNDVSEDALHETPQEQVYLQGKECLIKPEYMQENVYEESRLVLEKGPSTSNVTDTDMPQHTHDDDESGMHDNILQSHSTDKKIVGKSLDNCPLLSKNNDIETALLSSKDYSYDHNKNMYEKKEKEYHPDKITDSLLIGDDRKNEVNVPHEYSHNTSNINVDMSETEAVKIQSDDGSVTFDASSSNAEFLDNTTASDSTVCAGINVPEKVQSQKQENEGLAEHGCIQKDIQESCFIKENVPLDECITDIDMHNQSEGEDLIDESLQCHSTDEKNIKMKILSTDADTPSASSKDNGCAQIISNEEEEGNCCKILDEPNTDNGKDEVKIICEANTSAVTFETTSSSSQRNVSSMTEIKEGKYSFQQTLLVNKITFKPSENERNVNIKLSKSETASVGIHPDDDPTSSHLTSNINKVVVDYGICSDSKIKVSITEKDNVFKEIGKRSESVTDEHVCLIEDINFGNENLLKTSKTICLPERLEECHNINIEDVVLNDLDSTGEHDMVINTDAKSEEDHEDMITEKEEKLVSKKLIDTSFPQSDKNFKSYSEPNLIEGVNINKVRELEFSQFEAVVSHNISVGHENCSKQNKDILEKCQSTLSAKRVVSKCLAESKGKTTGVKNYDDKQIEEDGDNIKETAELQETDIHLKAHICNEKQDIIIDCNDQEIDKSAGTSQYLINMARTTEETETRTGGKPLRKSYDSDEIHESVELAQDLECDACKQTEMKPIRSSKRSITRNMGVRSDNKNAQNAHVLVVDIAARKTEQKTTRRSSKRIDQKNQEIKSKTGKGGNASNDSSMANAVMEKKHSTTKKLIKRVSKRNQGIKVDDDAIKKMSDASKVTWRSPKKACSRNQKILHDDVMESNEHTTKTMNTANEAVESKITKSSSNRVCNKKDFSFIDDMEIEKIMIEGDNNSNDKNNDKNMDAIDIVDKIKVGQLAVGKPCGLGFERNIAQQKAFIQNSEKSSNDIIITEKCKLKEFHCGSDNLTKGIEKEIHIEDVKDNISDGKQLVECDDRNEMEAANMELTSDNEKYFEKNKMVSNNKTNISIYSTSNMVDTTMEEIEIENNESESESADYDNIKAIENVDCRQINLNREGNDVKECNKEEISYLVPFLHREKTDTTCEKITMKYETFADNVDVGVSDGNYSSVPMQDEIMDMGAYISNAERCIIEDIIVKEEVFDVDEENIYIGSVNTVADEKLKEYKSKVKESESSNDAAICDISDFSGEEVIVTDKTHIKEEVIVTDKTHIKEEVIVTDKTHIKEEVIVTDKTHIKEEVIVTDKTHIKEEVIVTDKTHIKEEVIVTDKTHIKEEVILTDKIHIKEENCDGNDSVIDVVSLQKDGNISALPDAYDSTASDMSTVTCDISDVSDDDADIPDKTVRNEILDVGYENTESTKTEEFTVSKEDAKISDLFEISEEEENIGMEKNNDCKVIGVEVVATPQITAAISDVSAEEKYISDEFSMKKGRDELKNAQANIYVHKENVSIFDISDVSDEERHCVGKFVKENRTHVHKEDVEISDISDVGEQETCDFDERDDRIHLLEEIHNKNPIIDILDVQKDDVDLSDTSDRSNETKHISDISETGNDISDGQSSRGDDDVFDEEVAEILEDEDEVISECETIDISSADGEMSEIEEGEISDKEEEEIPDKKETKIMECKVDEHTAKTKNVAPLSSKMKFEKEDGEITEKEDGEISDEEEGSITKEKEKLFHKSSGDRRKSSRSSYRRIRKRSHRNTFKRETQSALDSDFQLEKDKEEFMDEDILSVPLKMVSEVRRSSRSSRSSSHESNRKKRGSDIGTSQDKELRGNDQSTSTKSLSHKRGRETEKKDKTTSSRSKDRVMRGNDEASRSASHQKCREVRRNDRDISTRSCSHEKGRESKGNDQARSTHEKAKGSDQSMSSRSTHEKAKGSDQSMSSRSTHEKAKGNDQSMSARSSPIEKSKESRGSYRDESKEKKWDKLPSHDLRKKLQSDRLKLKIEEAVRNKKEAIETKELHKKLVKEVCRDKKIRSDVKKVVAKKRSCGTKQKI